MRKRVFLFLCIVTTLLTFPVSHLAAQRRILFSVGYVDPTNPVIPRPKSPVVAPTVYIDGHALTFDTPCDGYTLQLVYEDNVVICTIVIPVGTTTLFLPSYLEGTFELQIIDGERLFYGEIEL